MFLITNLMFQREIKEWLNSEFSEISKQKLNGEIIILRNRSKFPI